MRAAVCRHSSGMGGRSSRGVGFGGGLAEHQTTGRCSDGSARSNKTWNGLHGCSRTRKRKPYSSERENAAASILEEDGGAEYGRDVHRLKPWT